MVAEEGTAQRFLAFGFLTPRITRGPSLVWKNPAPLRMATWAVFCRLRTRGGGVTTSGGRPALGERGRSSRCGMGIADQLLSGKIPRLMSEQDRCHAALPGSGTSEGRRQPEGEPWPERATPVFPRRARDPSRASASPRGVPRPRRWPKRPTGRGSVVAASIAGHWEEP